MNVSVTAQRAQRAQQRCRNNKSNLTSNDYQSLTTPILPYIYSILLHHTSTKLSDLSTRPARPINPSFPNMSSSSDDSPSPIASTQNTPSTNFSFLPPHVQGTKVLGLRLLIDRSDLSHVYDPAESRVRRGDLLRVVASMGPTPLVWSLELLSLLLGWLYNFLCRYWLR